MTYDEILHGLYFELKAAEFEDACGDGGWPIGVKALIAIVELHEPYGDVQCSICENGQWPCSTIRTISEALA